jgi:hypothetical protein
VNEWRSLSEAVREGGAPPIPYDQLLGVTRAMLAAVQSARTRQPVTI